MRTKKVVLFPLALLLLAFTGLSTGASAQETVEIVIEHATGLPANTQVYGVYQQGFKCQRDPDRCRLCPRYCCNLCPKRSDWQLPLDVENDRTRKAVAFDAEKQAMFYFLDTGEGTPAAIPPERITLSEAGLQINLKDFKTE